MRNLPHFDLIATSNEMLEMVLAGNPPKPSLISSQLNVMADAMQVRLLCWYYLILFNFASQEHWPPSFTTSIIENPSAMIFVRSMVKAVDLLRGLDSGYAIPTNVQQSAMRLSASFAAAEARAQAKATGVRPPFLAYIVFLFISSSPEVTLPSSHLQVASS